MCFNIYVIVLEDDKNSIKINLHIKINSLSDIFPEALDSYSVAVVYVEYIYLFKRSKKSHTLYSSDDIYNPIFVIMPQEFFKNANISKRLYNQNDKIVKISRDLIDRKFDDRSFIETDFNLKAITTFIDSSPNVVINKLFVNTKGICYAVELKISKSTSKSTSKVTKLVVPVKYSSVDNIPDKYFANEVKQVVHHPITSFACNNAKNIKKFIMSYNNFVVKISEDLGMTKINTKVDNTMHILNKKEIQVSPIFPFIKIESILANMKNTIMGFVSNGLRFYIPINCPLKEFNKYMSTNYDAFADTNDNNVFYLRYDPVEMNKIIYEHAASDSQVDENMKNISKIIYEKHLYYLFVSEMMAYLDTERNNHIRKQIMNVVSSGDLRGKLEAIYSSLQSILLPDHPEDLQRITDALSMYYTSHFDTKELLDEIEQMNYQFDRITLTLLKNSSEYFHEHDEKTQKDTLVKIQKIINDIVDKFVVKKNPVFTDNNIYLTECKSILGDNVSYCEKGKIMIPGKKLKELVDIFSEEIVNPLRRDYILSAVYMSDIMDMYKFPKIPGEEIYIRFS